MVQTLEALHQFCQTNGRSEKTLIVPSQYAGWQITNQYVQFYGSWVNLHTATISALVDEVLLSTLSEQKRQIATSFQTLAFAAKACQDTIPEKGYFGEIKNRLGFHHAMESTLNELSTQDTQRLLRGRASTNIKLKELVEVATKYRNLLNDAKLWLPEECISFAIQLLQSRPENTRPKRPIAILGEITLTKLEHKFLDLLSSIQPIVLPQESFSENIEKLELSMFRAVGEENEVRHVFRTALTKNIPFDKVELLYTETSSYLPLIYQLCLENEIPASFSSGLPITTTSIGQAATGFLKWLRDDYASAEIYSLLQLNCILLKDHSVVNNSTLAKTIRLANIGQGIARYHRQIELWERQLKTSSERTDENGETVSYKWHHQNIQAALSFVHELLSLIPESKNGYFNLSDVAKSLKNFLTQFTRTISESDKQSEEILFRLLNQIIETPELSIRASDAIAEILDTINELHWGAELPKPGKLHVAHFRSGGYSGRKYTFLIGMDEGRFPGSGNLDPILLDPERIQINEGKPEIPLKLRTNYGVDTERDLDNCIARIRRNLTLSYSCFDLLENREIYPATKLLKLYRTNQHLPESDFETLEKTFGEPIGYTDNEHISTSHAEQYLRQAIEFGPLFRETIFQNYPLLREGEIAHNSRLRIDLTPFDGWLNFAHPSLDPRTTGEAVSATRLSQLSKCAYAYFLTYVLQIEPTEELTRDPLEWLDALEYGGLLHKTFHNLMLEITQNKITPGELQLETIRTIVEFEIDSEVAHNPPAVDIFISDTQEQLLHACLLFLNSEEKRFEKYEPLFFEFSFGISKQSAPAEFDTIQPAPLLLANQKTVLLKGIIDRINRLRSFKNEYEIVDYKSGSDYSYSSTSAYNRGRQLQHGLYALALEIVLRENNRSGQVVQSGYFFPSKKSMGKWITFPLSDTNRQQVYDILTDLCDILDQSVFLRTNDVRDCKFCEYCSICGDVETVCAASGEKLANSPPVLLPIARLQNRV